MNIAYVVPEFVTETGGGGLASYINNISNILARMGNEIVIIVKSEKNETLKYAPHITVERTYVDLTGVDREKPGSIYREWSRVLNDKLLKCHKRFQFDVVQYANWNALAYYRTKIPTVVRISSDLPLWRAANRIDFSLGKKYPCIKMTDYLEDMALMNADIVFGPSNLIASVIAGRTGGTVHVVESPFPRWEYKSDKLLYRKLLSNKNYILTFGNLNLLKGIYQIGSSIYDILDRHREYYYVFAGKNQIWKDLEGKETDSVSFLKRQAGKYQDRLIFIDVVTREQLYPIIEKAGCCILPSRIDNLPNACIEAMSYGQIVIGTQGSSMEQLIEDGENGFLIERNEKESLVRAVDRVLSMNKDILKKISDNAKKRIEKMDSDRIAKETLELYEKAIAGSKSGFNVQYYNAIKSKIEEA